MMKGCEITVKTSPFYLKMLEADARALCCKVEKGASLKEHTTFKMGGPCNLLIHINTEKAFVNLIPFAEKLSIPYYIFGNGSNIIVDSDGISGVVFLVGHEFSSIYEKDENTFTCQAGASLISICNKALDCGLSGLEFAYSLPGTVGDAIFMNAGTYYGEMSDVVTSVKAMDRQGNINIYEGADLDFSYRNSRFRQSGEIILSAEIKLHPCDKVEIKARMDEFITKQLHDQPLDYPSDGCMFKRPEGV